MVSEFSVENPTKVMEVESFLSNNAYLSGDALPGLEDARILDLLQEVPDRTTYPNLFAWWWTLSAFQEPARKLWGKKKAKKEKKGKKGKKCKKVEEVKKEEEKKEEEDDDDLDLFGEETEEDKAALEELEKKMKKEKRNKAKLLAQKSRVTLDVKGYEVTQDFKLLGEKIMSQVVMKGLTWETNAQVLPLAFGMNMLRLNMLILDCDVSADSVIEKITELFGEEIQNVDVSDFQKA